MYIIYYNLIILANFHNLTYLSEAVVEHVLYYSVADFAASIIVNIEDLK